jgi:hypothetical protein
MGHEGVQPIAKIPQREWRSYPELAVFTMEDINHWLSRFIVEVRKLNGDFYPRNL